MNAIQHHRIEERCLAQCDWLSVQVGKLLKGNDAECVPFFSRRFQIPATQGFCDKLYENLADIDQWPESFVIQCLLAVGRGDLEQAAAIYENHLRAGINEFAEKCVQEAAA